MFVYLWLLFGALSFAFTIIGLARTVLNKRRFQSLLQFLSLMSGIFSLLAAFAQTYLYVLRGDWAAMEDVVPALFGISAICALLCTALNTVLFILSRKH